MELAEALRRRQMIRNYDPERPVPHDVVTALLAAAGRAPSAGFTQGVSLLVLEAAEDRETFWTATAPVPADPAATGTVPASPADVAAEQPKAAADPAPNRWLRGMRTAPLLILVWTSREAYLDRYAEPDKGWLDREESRWSAPYWYVDAGMAAMAVLLAAVDEELGACFFGVPVDRAAAVRAAFGVPEEQLSIGVISVGYPAANGSPGSPRRRPRRDPNDLIHRSHWTSSPPNPLRQPGSSAGDS